MRIQLKSADEIRLMRAAGLVAAEILEDMCVAAKPGVSTWELDQIARAGSRSTRGGSSRTSSTPHPRSPSSAPDDKDDLARLTETYTGLRALAKPGMATGDRDHVIKYEVDKHKVRSAFLNYNAGGKVPYPGVVCTSRNEVIVHGIPRKDDVIADGDIIGIDFGIFMHGFCADTARTVMIGNVSPANRQARRGLPAGPRAGDRPVPGPATAWATSATPSRSYVESQGY